METLVFSRFGGVATISRVNQSQLRPPEPCSPERSDRLLRSVVAFPRHTHGISTSVSLTGCPQDAPVPIRSVPHQYCNSGQSRNVVFGRSRDTGIRWKRGETPTAGVRLPPSTVCDSDAVTLALPDDWTFRHGVATLFSQMPTPFAFYMPSGLACIL